MSLYSATHFFASPLSSGEKCRISIPGKILSTNSAVSSTHSSPDTTAFLSSPFKLASANLTSSAKASKEMPPGGN